MPEPQTATDTDSTDTDSTTVTLSADAVAIIAGFLAPSDEEVNTDGIYGSEAVWTELRTTFPLSAFRAWAERWPVDRMLDSGGNGYDPDAGF